MKKTILGLIIILFLSSCEDNFNPYAEYEENYAVNALLRGDKSYQTVTIVKSVSPQQYQNGELQKTFVANAQVKVTANGYTYAYKDSVIFDENNNQINFYYMDTLKAKRNTTYNLEVTLPDGKKLTSTTNSTSYFEIDENYSTAVLDPGLNDRIVIQWIMAERYVFYEPKLYINYSIAENGVERRTQLEVPQSYITRDGQVEPKYADPSAAKYFIMNYETLTTALAQLNDLVPDPKHIKIFDAYLVVKVFDVNLTKYYSSANYIANAFSTRVYGTDFSNINGGLGVFGTYLFYDYKMLISSDYIKSFGYLVGF